MAWIVARPAIFCRSSSEARCHQTASGSVSCVPDVATDVGG